MNCTSKGDPTPTIRWSRENGQLPQFSFSANGLLSISPVTLEDGGAYVCTAANTFGVDAELVTLTVERGKVNKLWQIQLLFDIPIYIVQLQSLGRRKRSTILLKIMFVATKKCIMLIGKTCS